MVLRKDAKTDRQQYGNFDHRFAGGWFLGISGDLDFVERTRLITGVNFGKSTTSHLMLVLASFFTGNLVR